MQCWGPKPRLHACWASTLPAGRAASPALTMPSGLPSVSRFQEHTLFCLDSCIRNLQALFASDNLCQDLAAKKLSPEFLGLVLPHIHTGILERHDSTPVRSVQPNSLKIKTTITRICVCICMFVSECSMLMRVRRQLGGLSFLLAPCVREGLSSNHQAWQRTLSCYDCLPSTVLK